MTGQVFSHYRVLAELGAGGMGRVYRAQDLRLKRQVALKFLPEALARDPTASERFRREAETVSALNHPHICTLYDFGEHDGQPFLVLELLEGQALDKALAAGRLSPSRVIALALEAADALDAAHTRGIVHRDIKPANIWVTTRGDAKVLDFGIAKLVGATAPLDAAAGTEMSLTMPGGLVGTPGYMAPEQVRGEPVDSRTDLFALGLVMFEMATGHRAFPGSTTGVIVDALLNRAPRRPSELNPEVPAALEHVILKAVEKDPSLRYQSARDLMADLRRVQRDTDPPRPSQGEVGHRPARSDPMRRPVVVLTAAVAVVLAALAVTWMLSRVPAAPTTARTESGPARLVVLPFENLTRQSSDDWLAGAFSDALSAGLQPLDNLVLVPRERVVELYAAQSRLESQSLSSDLARQISRDLRVRYYVHGSYQRVGDDLRVMARLVDAEKDAIEAQETLTDRVANVFALEDELATRFAASFGARGSIATRQSETPSLEAYQAVSDARAHYALGRLREARTLLQQAVDRAPRYAAAWAWLSKTDSRLAAPSSYEGRISREMLQQALDGATTAVSLEPALIDAQIALALAYRGLGMLPAQRAAAEHALALDRRNGEALMIIGDSYAISPSLRCPGDPQPERAEQRFREALAIDPLTSGRISLTTHLWWMNRQTEAHQNMVEGLSIQPGNVQLKLWSPFNMAFAGRAEEAFGLWRSGLENPQQLRPLDAFIAGIIDLKRREFETADDYLRRAGSQITEALPFSLILAVTQFQAGRMSEGATSLQQGLERDSACPAWFDRAPAFAPFKDAPAVRAVLARVRGT